MLGSFANSSSSNGIEPLRSRLPSKPAAKETNTEDQNLSQLLEREWSELPYAMMRITAAGRSWDANRLYWRDRTVQLGEIDLNLVDIRPEDGAPTYSAVYNLDELRREFILQPSLEDDLLRWSALGISDVQLTTGQLAEKLLSKLVTFYTTGLSNPPATSSASPGPSS